MAPRTSTKSTVKRKTTPKASDATIAKKKETEDISRLIEQRLQTPPNVPESDDDSVSADKNNDEEEKQKQNSCSNNDLNRISEPKKAISTTSFIIKNGEKVLMTMNREHSMFMNCIPLTRDKLGPDVLAKIRSVVRNGLFKSAKFYPNPSHANPVVGLWLYDCDFREPGVAGDNERMRRWETVRSEIIMQTAILRQQVVPHWYKVVRGTSSILNYTISKIKTNNYISNFMQNGQKRIQTVHSLLLKLCCWHTKTYTAIPTITIRRSIIFSFGLSRRFCRSYMYRAGPRTIGIRLH